MKETICQNILTNNQVEDSEQFVFDDIKYICSSTNLIVSSLQKGFDVAQLPSGDIIVTEVKMNNILYCWDKTKHKMVRDIIVDNDEKNQNEFVFDNIEYICSSTSLIIDSLQKGFDVAQLPSGDIIVTEVKIINILYYWDKLKAEMVKISQM